MQTGFCTGEADRRDAAAVCEKLQIPFKEVNFVKEYWSFVFERVLRDFERGHTPNPDIWCNREIKFRAFLAHALQDADFVATGHYARVLQPGELDPLTQKRNDSSTAKLLTSADSLKDQTYFLAMVHPGSLSRVLFPVGAMSKVEVRRIAREQGLITAAKRDSTGICFIGNRRFPAFLSQYLPQTPGEFVSIETGEILGKHDGLALYTTGQAARLAGRKDKLYVVRKVGKIN